MNPQIHTALAELQDALAEINDINQAIKQTELGATEAVYQAAQTIKRAQSLFEEVKDEHKQGLTQLNQNYEKLETSLLAKGDQLQETALGKTEALTTSVQASTQELQKAMGQVEAQHQHSLERMLQNFQALEQSLLAKGEQLQQAALEKTDAYSGTLTTATVGMQQDIANALLPYQELAEASKTLTDYLQSVNFPARLDKMDSSIMTINQGVQNLSDKLDRQKDQLIQSLAEMQQNQETKMGVLKKQQNLYFGLSFAVMLVITALVIFL